MEIIRTFNDEPVTREEEQKMALILIIDDDDQIRRMLRKTLERDGYDVADAPNGKEGIRICRENPAALVITDLIMPEKDGIETIIELRKGFPEVKIIAMSGGGNIAAEDYLMMAKGLGAMRIFSKPIELEELLKAVRELLE